MIEIIGLTAVGLAFAAFVFVVLVVVCVMLWRAFRPPPPAPPAAVPAVAPGYLDLFRPAPPPPNFLDGMVAYGNQRKAEIDRDRYRAALDTIAGITGPGSAAPQPPNS